MPDSPSSAAKTGRNVLLGLLLAGLVVSELLALFVGHPALRDGSQWFAIVCVLAMPLTCLSSLHGRELYLASACGLLIAIAWWLQVPLAALITDGLARSAFLAAFIVLMALLREGANSSASILEVGRYLTHQPPGRRFFTIFGGSHFFSLLINLGSLSLLAPIIQRGVRASYGDGQPIDEIGQVREQRQLSAALRGFSWFLVWGPTAVTQAVMPTLMTGINPYKLIGLGLCIALLMMFVARFEDWLRWRKFSARLGRSEVRPTNAMTPLPRHSFRNVALVAVTLFGLSIAFSTLGQVTLIAGVMLASPFVTIWWLAVQYGRSGKAVGHRMTTRLDTITFVNMPAYSREVIFVACAGFIGTSAAKLIPVPELAETLQLDTLPSWLILWSLSLFVLLLGQVGFSPITSAVFLGSVVAEVPVLPLDTTLIAIAIAAGTAICSTGAPFSAGILMLSRATEISPYTLSWRWNGRYTLFASVILLPVYGSMASLFG